MGMNPADKARKQARKKELKKNKKNREEIRVATLKCKDPKQILTELEDINSIEFDVNQPPTLSVRVLADKRSKLLGSFHAVLKMYEKEDKNRWSSLKALKADYDKRRTELVRFYESVKLAEQIQIDNIPLPSGPPVGNIPLPQVPMAQTSPLYAMPGTGVLSVPPEPLVGDIPVPLPIVQKPVLYAKPGSNVPGVPPGPPPVLSDSEEEVEMDVQVSTGLKLPGPLPGLPMGVQVSTGLKPPGPPPGLPPWAMGHQSSFHPRPPVMPYPMNISSHGLNPYSASGNVKVVGRPVVEAPAMVQIQQGGKRNRAVFEGTPQIRDLGGESTKFMPTSLILKREARVVKKRRVGRQNVVPVDQLMLNVQRPATRKMETDAYAEFMEEMKGIL